jgi:phosphoribosylglycinamide formyltransferase 1
MKIAIICSAGGSAFFTAYDILIQTGRFECEDFIVVTDRACQAEQNAKDRGISYKRVEFESKSKFSQEVTDMLIEKQVTAALMLYSRLVSSDLYLRLPTFNIHPALLPAFKGMKAINQVLESGVKFLGATIHLTTEKVDDGQIIGQVSSPIEMNANKAWLDKLSFLQKTYLILMFIDALQTGVLKIGKKGTVTHESKLLLSPSANPCVQTIDLRNLFENYQTQQQMQGAIQ